MIPIRDLPTEIEEAENEGWVQIGKGCSRRGFSHEQHPLVVLKIGFTHLNERECEMWEEFCESAFSFSLTPILARSQYFHSILMKRVLAPHSWKDPLTESFTEHAERRGSLVGINNFLDHSYKDFHSGNWGYIPDDYGNYVPGQLIDYAGAP